MKETIKLSYRSDIKDTELQTLIDNLLDYIEETNHEASLTITKDEHSFKLFNKYVEVLNWTIIETPTDDTQTPSDASSN